MKFVLDVFPVVVTVGGLEYSDEEFSEMLAGYDELFARGERYALITYSPDGAQLPSARDRKRITDWANSPRVRDYSKKLCVGSATVAQNVLMRGALTAITWLWKPSAPHKAVGSPNEAIDWCLHQLEGAGVRVPFTRDQVFAKLGTKAFGSAAA